MIAFLLALLAAGVAAALLSLRHALDGVEDDLRFSSSIVEPGESFVDAVKREMREETGLEIRNPRLVGVKQFPIEGGRYVVFLFRADEYAGSLVSSDEGRMEWVERCRLAELETVADLELLLKVMESPALSEFQYLVDGDAWTAVVR